ncbi:hypothetical protein ILUMI_15509 [Ignelater luminosus]|uniref:Secreted protein n=1 Tax=Ignelater luminosus TaxID=2038154 RepID=A0A8K0CNF7_IGNLU|nr:hypothetical protein ILUMI_15509 [Ignelater luminosus]
MNKLYRIITVFLFCFFGSISTDTEKELLPKTDLSTVIKRTIANISEDALRKYLDINKEALKRFGGKLELLAEKVLEEAEMEYQDAERRKLTNKKKPLKIYIDPEPVNEEVSSDTDKPVV